MSLGSAGPQKRERAIDLFKGLLVTGMVYCHTLQFFSDPQIYPEGRWIIDMMNLMTFSGFVFSFGYAAERAYYSKPFRLAASRLLLSAAKPLLAFYISGTAYRVFIDGKPLDWTIIQPILLIQDMPGWSEFLVSFTYLMCMGLVLFKPLQWLAERKALAFGFAGLMLCSTFLPYHSFHGAMIGPLLGTRDHASFPVLAYFPYYILGILFAKYRIVWDWRVLVGAAVATVSFIVKWLSTEGLMLPERFPPSIWWIVGPALLLYGYYLLSRLLEQYPVPFAPLEAMGRNVLWYLVMSNLLIFALKRHQRDSLLLSEWGSLCLTIGLLAVAAFSVWIIAKRQVEYGITARM